MFRKGNERTDSFFDNNYSREQIEEEIQYFKDSIQRHLSSPPKRVTGFWIYHQSRWPLLRLDVPFQDNLFLAEAKRLLQKSERTLEKGSRGWHSFSLLNNRGFSIQTSADLLEAENEFSKFEFNQGAGPELLAYSLALRLPLEKILAVEYSVLEPGGLVVPHLDTIDEGMTRFHFCISQPEKAYTYFERYGCAPYENGSCFIFDPSVKHAAVNFSDQPRYFLQISGSYGSKLPDLYKLLENSYQKYSSQE